MVGSIFGIFFSLRVKKRSQFFCFTKIPRNFRIISASSRIFRITSACILRQPPSPPPRPKASLIVACFHCLLGSPPPQDPRGTTSMISRSTKEPPDSISLSPRKPLRQNVTHTDVCDAILDPINMRSKRSACCHTWIQYFYPFVFYFCNSKFHENQFSVFETGFLWVGFSQNFRDFLDAFQDTFC